MTEWHTTRCINLEAQLKVSLVIPMYNESSIVRNALETYSSYMDKTFDDWELIFVDDGSKDGCGKVINEASEKDARIRLEGYEVNRGKGYAVKTGVLASKGDIVIFTDCDNAYGEETIGRAVEQMTSTGADMLIGSRNLTKDGYEEYSFIRRFASKLYIKVICIFAGFKLSDSQCGFKGFKGEVGRKLFKYSEVERFAFDLEIILIAQKAGHTITEMPVKVVNHRESKVHLVRDTLKVLSDLRKMKKRIKKLEIA